MSSFSEDPSEWQRLDWRLLQNGPVALYRCPQILADDSAWLRAHGYSVEELECARWDSPREFHEDVARRLSFPNHYGRNMSAFGDCLGEIEIPEVGGRVIVFHRFDRFARREVEIAQQALDIVATTAWRYLLLGRRLVALVQSDDPNITFGPVGAHPVMWNPREWLNKDRVH